MILEQKALQFATEAHNGQFRKDEVTPYIEHPIEVVNLLKSVEITEPDIIASGYLHDVVEDCNITLETISKEFNSEVSRIVAALTRDVDREKYKERIKNSDYKIQIVKLADVVHNCSTINEPYIHEETRSIKIQDCNSLYFDLAKKISPKFYKLLVEYMDLH